MMNKIDLPDVNVLFALVQPSHAAHTLAWSWFDDTAGFAMTPITELGLLRLSMNPKVMGQQITFADAVASLSSLRDDPRSCFVADDSSLTDASISLQALQGYRQVTDLHLVNLAARHKMVLTTLDRSLQQSLLPADRHHIRLLG